MDDEKYKIPLFDGTNYSNWKFRMQVLLEKHDLIDYINTPLDVFVRALPAGSADPQAIVMRKKVRKCKSFIIQRIADSHLKYVKEKVTAYEMWQALSESFERKGVASQLRLRKMLLTMRYATTETMVSHFLKFDKLVRELKLTGANLVETDIVCHLLLTMPEEYNMVVTALETLSSEQLTLGFVKTRLFNEKAKRGANVSTKDTNSSTVFSAATKNRKSNVNKREGEVNGKNRARFNFKCHYCGIIEHKRSECRKLKLENKDSESAKAALDDSVDNRKEFVFITKSEEITDSSTCWF
ncbi:Copia protein [Cyphomyrmex costatus]|uniref:Copia protein n=1 Tax=Cyphomyrmex costatus TaxID=456900 RepID=A0A151II55_9HYME|nr:Copia protein [Cyphomyrmex costatus]